VLRRGHGAARRALAARGSAPLSLSLSLSSSSTRSTAHPTAAGIPIKWTNAGFLKPGAATAPAAIPPAIIHHTALAHDLAVKARLTCRKLLGDEGELQLMRLHTTTKEYIIAPAEHETLLVVQAAHSAALEPLVQAADAAQLAALAHAKGGKEEKKK
jgi:hypothetical protein